MRYYTIFNWDDIDENGEDVITYCIKVYDNKSFNVYPFSTEKEREKYILKNNLIKLEG